MWGQTDLAGEIYLSPIPTRRANAGFFRSWRDEHEPRIGRIDRTGRGDGKRFFWADRTAGKEGRGVDVPPHECRLRLPERGARVGRAFPRRRPRLRLVCPSGTDLARHHPRRPPGALSDV